MIRGDGTVPRGGFVIHYATYDECIDCGQIKLLTAVDQYSGELLCTECGEILYDMEIGRVAGCADVREDGES